MRCGSARRSASTSSAAKLAAAPTHLLLEAVACLLFLSLAWDFVSVDGATDLVGQSRWIGVFQPAFAAEEPVVATEEGHPATPAEAEMQEVEPVEVVQVDVQTDFDDEAAAEEAAAASPSDAASLYGDLSTFSDEELKALLSDKKKGQVNFKRYKDRGDLIKAIREVETKEIAQKAFRDEVDAAARWYAETQEELKYQRAAARRAKSSRIKHDGDLPPALRHDDDTNAPAHELRIVYDAANGYRRHFDAMVKDLESLETVRLPNLDAFRIVGEPYPVSKENALLGQVLQVCFYGVMAVAIVPDLVPFIPEAGRNILRTRRGLVISTAFMLNMLARTVLQSNAYEVYLDGDLIYSTIKLSGRLPTSEMVSKLLLERTLLKDYAAAMSAKAAAALL